MSENPGKNSPKPSPIKILELFEPLLAAYPYRTPHERSAIEDYVRIAQPAPREKAMLKVLEVFHEIRIHRGIAIEDEVTLIKKFIAFVGANDSNGEFINPGMKLKTSHSNCMALLKLGESNRQAPELRLEALSWLYSIIKHTEYEYHLIDPKIYYEHLKDIRLGLSNVLNETSMREKLKQGKSFTTSLCNLVELAQPILNKGGLESNEVLNKALQAKLLHIQKLAAHELTLGQRQQEASERLTETTRAKQKSAELQNRVHSRLKADIERDRKDCKVATRAQTEKQQEQAADLSYKTDAALFEMALKIANGDSAVAVAAGLAEFTGSEPRVVARAMRHQLLGAAYANNPTPVEAHRFLASELFCMLMAIRQSTGASILTRALLLIMLTHLDAERIEQTTLANTIDASEPLRPYLSADNVLGYTVENSPTGQPAMLMALALPAPLADSLRADIESGVLKDGALRAAYTEAKKQRLGLPYPLPQLLSQWGHAAHELLSEHLTDIELSVLSGRLNFRNRIPSYYTNLNIETINTGFQRGVAVLLDRLDPELCHDFPLRRVLSGFSETLPKGQIGSERFAVSTHVAPFITALYARSIQQTADIKRALKRQAIDLTALINELNSACLNDFLLTQAMTSGRGNSARMVLTPQNTTIRMDDKSTAQGPNPRFCCTIQPNGTSTLRALWFEQKRCLQAQIGLLTRCFPAQFSAHSENDSQALTPIFMMQTSDWGLPCYTPATLTWAHFKRLVESFGLEAPDFPANIFRHVWATQTHHSVHETVAREQLGHHAAGREIAHPHSSADLRTLAEQHTVLDTYIAQFGFKLIPLTDITATFKAVEEVNHANQ